MSSGAGRPAQAMAWVNEIDSAKSLADLSTPKSISGDAKVISRFWSPRQPVASRRSFKETPKEEFSWKRMLGRKCFLTGRQIVWVIFEFFMIIGTDEFVLDAINLVVPCGALVLAIS